MPELDLDLARAAVDLPGWQWMLGMLNYFHTHGGGDRAPDYRDPATAGCLLSMLGPGWVLTRGTASQGYRLTPYDPEVRQVEALSLGEACIRAAIARGGWGVR